VPPVRRERPAPHGVQEEPGPGVAVPKLARQQRQERRPVVPEAQLRGQHRPLLRHALPVLVDVIPHTYKIMM